MLILGDCFVEMIKIPPNLIDAIICDPPFFGLTNNKWDQPFSLEKMWECFNYVIKPDGAIVICAAQPFTSKLIMSNLDMFKYEWIWEKHQGTGHLNAKKQPLRNHESIVVFYKSQPTYNPQFTEGKPYKCKSGRGSTNYNEQHSVITENDGKRYPLTVLKFQHDKPKIHPTQKPVNLMQYMIETYTNKNEIVLDPFMGSGSTIVAAIKTGRKYIGIEKDEPTFNLAKTRIEAHGVSSL